MAIKRRYGKQFPKRLWVGTALYIRASGNTTMVTPITEEEAKVIHRALFLLIESGHLMDEEVEFAKKLDEYFRAD